MLTQQQAHLDLTNAIKRIENLRKHATPDVLSDPYRRPMLKEIRDLWQIILRTDFQYISPIIREQLLVVGNIKFPNVGKFGEAMAKDIRRQSAIDYLFSKQTKQEIQLRKGWNITLQEHNQRLSEIIQMVQLLTEITLEGIEDQEKVEI